MVVALGLRAGMQSLPAVAGLRRKPAKPVVTAAIATTYAMLKALDLEQSCSIPSTVLICANWVGRRVVHGVEGILVAQLRHQQGQELILHALRGRGRCRSRLRAPQRRLPAAGITGGNTGGGHVVIAY